jgi:hypothetical protein
MQQPPKKKHFAIWLEYPKGVSRTIHVKAVTREVAEKRALKRNPGAIGVKQL